MPGSVFVNQPPGVISTFQYDLKSAVSAGVAERTVAITFPSSGGNADGYAAVTVGFGKGSEK